VQTLCQCLSRIWTIHGCVGKLAAIRLRQTRVTVTDVSGFATFWTTGLEKLVLLCFLFGKIVYRRRLGWVFGRVFAEWAMLVPELIALTLLFNAIN
jgi:hypothetical protein